MRRTLVSLIALVTGSIVPSVMADLWYTDGVNFTHDYSAHKKKVREKLQRQMLPQMVNFLENNRNYPGVEMFLKNNKKDSLDSLKQQIERKLNGLSEYTVSVIASAHTSPQENSWLADNLEVECHQSVGGESSSDWKINEVPIGIGSSSYLTVSFDSPKFSNGENVITATNKNASVTAKPEAKFEVSFTIGIPAVSGKGYALKMETLQSKNDLPPSAKSEVIVALIAKKLHIRVFNQKGEIVADATEGVITESQNAKMLKNALVKGSREWKLLAGEDSKYYQEVFLKMAIAISSPIQTTLTGKAFIPIKDSLELTISPHD